MNEPAYLVGLLGRTIQGSLGPALHVQEGRAQGLTVDYRLIDAAVTPYAVTDLGQALKWAVRFGFCGLNVTFPFKIAVMEHLDELTPEAKVLGAVNTITVRDGRTIGHNTDWIGFGDNLVATLPDVVRDPVTLLGAGGAGVAVGYAALRLGAEHLAVVDSDEGRATRVADILGGEFGRDRVSAGVDVAKALVESQGLIQATPVGMHGWEGLPLPEELVTPDHWFAELIYFPVETELLHLARQRGCRVATGWGMAAYQHRAAFQLFTGRPADADRMLRHIADLVDAGAEAGP